MILDGYIRVSRLGGREGESFISPAVQRERIEGWAKSQSVTIGQWHEDYDVSGSSLKRPGLDAVMKRIEAGATGGIAVAKLDRLSRAGVGEALKLVERINDHGGKLAALDLGVDPTTPFGEFTLTLLLALGRMERQRIGENWNTARAKAIARGVHLRTMFGYDRGEHGRLVPSADAPHVAEAFRMRAARKSLGEVAAYLNAHSTTTSGAAWQPATVSKLFATEAYLGVAFSGEHRREGAHEPLVNSMTFRAAQKVRGVNPRKSNDAPQLFGGLVRCAACRYTAKRGKGKGHAVSTYRCKAHHGGGRCPEPFTMSEPKLDAYIIEQLVERMNTVGGARVSIGGDPMEAGHGADYELAEKALTDARAGLEDYVTDLDVKKAIGREAFLAGLEARQDAVSAADEALAAIESPVGSFDVDRMVLTPAEGREDALESMLWRQLGSQLIDTIFVARGGQGPAAKRVHICWRGEGPRDLPGRGRKAQPIKGYEK